MFDLSKCYQQDGAGIETLFKYNMSMLQEKDHVLLRIKQIETGSMLEIYLTRGMNEIKDVYTSTGFNSIFIESSLSDISLVELGFLALDVLFYIFRKLGIRFLKIHTNEKRESEMDWVKEVIPATRELWDDGQLSYIFPILPMNKNAFHYEWRDKLEIFKKKIWKNYDKDHLCRDYLSGKLAINNQATSH